MVLYIKMFNGRVLGGTALSMVKKNYYYCYCYCYCYSYYYY